MADNTTLNSMTGGDVIATDDIVGAKYQRVKLIHGADGTNDGDVSTTNPLPIKLKESAVVISSTTTPLTASATWTSATFDTSLYGNGVMGVYYADQNGTHIVEVSQDTTTWDIIHQDSYLATEVMQESHISNARYIRHRFVNGGTNQTVFRGTVIQRINVSPEKIGLDDRFNQIRGDKQNNTSVVSTDAVETLVAIANAAAPTRTEGYVGALRTTLTGDLAVTLDSETVTLGAGTAEIGKLAASVANIGDVDILTIAAGDNNIGNVDIVTVPAPLSTTGGGTEATALRVTIASDSTGVVSIDDNGSSITVDQATASNLNATVVQGTATNLKVEPDGNVAHDGVDSGNPIKTGGIARTANPTATAALDRVASFYDTEGRQVVQPYGPRALTIHGNVTITTTSETTVIPQAAGVFHDLCGVVIANSSATAIYVTFKDATAGTTRFIVYAPAGQTVGFMPPLPVTQSAVNGNWTATCSAGVTSIYIFAIAVKKTG